MNRLALALLLGLAACAHPAPTRPPPAFPPRPTVGALPAFDAPRPQVMQLANGLTLVVRVRPDAPLETLVFTSQLGAVEDGPHAGLASLAGEMLQAGSAGRSASQVAEATAALGTELHIGAAREDLSALITVLPEMVPRAAQLLGEVVLHPNLEARELTRVKAEHAARLLARLDEPRDVADDVLDAQLFGESAYGRPVEGTPQSVGALSLADVRRFLARVGGANSALVAVGPATVEALRALAERHFGALPRGLPAPMHEAHPRPQPPAVVLVDKPGASQSVLRLGAATVAASSPDRVALRLANVILGGSFTSRINQNLREAHGFSYGASSDVDLLRGGGVFVAESDVKTERTGLAARELRAEVARMASQGLRPAELDKARALVAADVVQSLQTTSDAARDVAGAWVKDLPVDELAHLLDEVAALDADAVNAAWKRAITPERLTLVIVGDREKVAPQLREAGLPAPVIVQVK